MWLVGVVVRRYIDFLLLIPTPLASVLFAAASLLFVHLKKCFLNNTAKSERWFELIQNLKCSP